MIYLKPYKDESIEKFRTRLEKAFNKAHDSYINHRFNTKGFKASLRALAKSDRIGRVLRKYFG